jgi:hypothetical protein
MHVRDKAAYPNDTHMEGLFDTILLVAQQNALNAIQRRPGAHTQHSEAQWLRRVRRDSQMVRDHTLSQRIIG